MSNNSTHALNIDKTFSKLSVIGGKNVGESAPPDLFVTGGARIKRSCKVDECLITNAIKPKKNGELVLDGNVTVTGTFSSNEMNDSVDANVVCSDLILTNAIEGKDGLVGNAFAQPVVFGSPLIFPKTFTSRDFGVLQTGGGNERNICLGYQSGYSIGKNLYNSYNITYNGAYSNLYAVSDSILIGYQTGYKLGDIGSYDIANNVLIGNLVAKNCRNPKESTVVGTRALYSAGENSYVSNAVIVGTPILTDSPNIERIYTSTFLGSRIMDNGRVEYSSQSIAAGFNLCNGLHRFQNAVAIGHTICGSPSGAYGFVDLSNSVCIGGRLIAEPINYRIGNNQVVIGYNNMSGAGQNNALGNSQIVIGSNSMRSGSSGAENIAIGTSAMGSISIATFDHCISIGSSAGLNLTSGTNITTIGTRAGQTIGTGSNTTCVGADSGFNAPATNFNNNTCIGYQAWASSGTATNEVTLGNTSVTSLRCAVTTITSTSDRRDKTDIQDLQLGIQFIKKLRPVQFKWDRREWYENEESDGSKKESEFTAGFIAQELKQVQRDEGVEWMNLVLENNPNKLEATPGKLLFPLIKAVQELIAENEQLRTDVQLLKNCNK